MASMEQRDMADDDDLKDLQIEIEPDEPEDDAGKDVDVKAGDKDADKADDGKDAPAVVKTAEEAKGPDAAAAELARQRDEIERRADQRVQTAERTTIDARREAAQARLYALNSGVEKAEAEIADIKRRIVEANNAGEIEKATDLALELSDKNYERRDILRERDWLDGELKKPVQNVSTDPVERLARNAEAAGAPLSQRAQAWLRQHVECVTDDEANAKVTWAHKAALKKGLPADSDEYYAFVEEQMGYAKPKANGKTEASEDDDAKPAKPRRTAAVPAAPVSRGSSEETTSRGGDVIKLTKREAQSATDGTITWNHDDDKGRFKKGDPIGIKEFARRKQALQKEGAYDRIHLTQ